MGNDQTVDTDVIDPDDDLIMSLIEEISYEIDDEYIDDQIPGFVKPIDSIRELYKYQKIIGRGITGFVLLAQSVQTYKQYALKQMKRSNEDNLSSFLAEINVLQQLNHPNIVRFNAAYISKDNYYIITEYCSGGTLLERIVKMKRFSERNCADFIKKILESLQYLHSKNIVHRDIKLANIVFDHDDIKHSKLKLIDFGQSEEITDVHKLDKEVIGSLHFFPPETLRSREKQELFAGDIWAVGIMAYVLIEGKWPYDGKDLCSMMTCIVTSQLKWNEHIPISNSCKHFIHALLHKDTKKRLNAMEALKHPWIINQATDDNLGDAYFDTLKRLNFQNKLQRVMVQAVLDGLDETDRKSLLSGDGYDDDNELINTIICAERRASKLNIRYKHTVGLSQKSLDEMDVDGILSEIDVETGQSNTDFDYLTPTPTPKRKYVDDDDDSEPEPETFDVSPTMDDSISVERFVEILQSSSKKYDIPTIVANVTDGSERESVSFRKIACYHQPMESMN